MKILCAVAASILLASGASAYAADDCPSKTIRFVNLYAPGGGLDLVARSVARQLSEKWKMSVIVENKPGAGGTIAASYVARQPGDGCTFFITDVSYSVVPSLYGHLSYDPVKDLKPVILLNTVTQAFTIRGDLGVNSLRELVDRAKKAPDQMTYASAGTGSLPHIGMEMFKKAADVHIRQIPYRGSVPAFTDLLAGRVDMYLGAIATPYPHVKDGKLKVVAVMQDHRSELVPDVPSIAELGYPDLDFAAYYGLLAPPNTPAPVVNKIAAAIQEIMKTPEMKKLMDELGDEAVGAGPEQFSDFLKKSMETWRRGAEFAGIKPE